MYFVAVFHLSIPITEAIKEVMSQRYHSIGYPNEDCGILLQRRKRFVYLKLHLRVNQEVGSVVPILREMPSAEIITV